MKMPSPKEIKKVEQVLYAQLHGKGSKTTAEDSKFMKKIAHNYPDWCATNGIVPERRRDRTIRRV